MVILIWLFIVVETDNNIECWIFSITHGGV